MFSSVSPNAAHNALAALELRGRLSHLVTQARSQTTYNI
jgi:NAD-dependent SIR2 family protein deacetylase